MKCAATNCASAGSAADLEIVQVGMLLPWSICLCKVHAHSLRGLISVLTTAEDEKRARRRDMFAAAAIPKAWAYCEERFHHFTNGAIAREAWGIADAMIETENDDDGDTKAANAASEKPNAGAGGGS